MGNRDGVKWYGAPDIHDIQNFPPSAYLSSIAGETKYYICRAREMIIEDHRVAGLGAYFVGTVSISPWDEKTYCRMHSTDSGTGSPQFEVLINK